MFYTLAFPPTRLFLDRLKKTQGPKNSSLKKITQNSSKKLKVSAKFEKGTTKIDSNKGENTPYLLKLGEKT